MYPLLGIRTSNPTILAHAMRNRASYDGDIARKAVSARSAEDLFFEPALADLTRAAELFRPVFARTDGVDGWVSLEISPLLTNVRAYRTCSSRFQAPRRDYRPSRKRSSSVFRST